MSDRATTRHALAWCESRRRIVPRLALPFIAFILAIFTVISRSIYHILRLQYYYALDMEDYNV